MTTFWNYHAVLLTLNFRLHFAIPNFLSALVSYCNLKQPILSCLKRTWLNLNNLNVLISEQLFYSPEEPSCRTAKQNFLIIKRPVSSRSDRLVTEPAHLPFQYQDITTKYELDQYDSAFKIWVFFFTNFVIYASYTL